MYEKQAEWEKKFAFTYSSPHVCLVCKEEQPVLSQYGCLALVSLHIFLVIITIVTDVATSSFTPTRTRGLVLCTMMHRGAGQLGLGVKRCIVSMDRCPILPHQFCLRLFFLPPLAHSNLITGPSLPLPRNPWTASQRRPESAPCFPTRDAPPPHLLRIKLTEAS